MTVETEKMRLRIQAELFQNNSSLGTFVTEDQDRMIIGSSKRADLVVPHEAISQIHAMLRVNEQKEIFLYDLGSEQGTFVSGEKIVERQLASGDFFEIGSHRVRVNILDEMENAQYTERALFWEMSPSSGSHLELLHIEDGIVREEHSISRRGKLNFGTKRHQILLNSGETSTFIRRKKDTVECTIPKGFTAEIFDGKNQLVRLIEQEKSAFTFTQKEKARLKSGETRELLLYWRTEGERGTRSTRDNERDTLKKTLGACLAVASIILTLGSIHFVKKEVIEEATIPKTSYMRMTMESAPAPANEKPAATTEESSAKAEEEQQAPPSKVASLSSALSKLLHKKSSLTAESIQAAISNNGTKTVRASGITSNVKSEQIGTGISGGNVNVNALSTGLSGGGKAGSLNGFAGGKGGSFGVPGGTGFGGKGFNMSLGGDEAEAIGGLDKALIAAVVQANIGQIKHCYEKQLIVDPNIFGKIVAQWTIDKDGLVPVDSLKKTTMNNKTVENCILGKIKGWTFPKPKGGGQVIVSYPFLFKSLN